MAGMAEFRLGTLTSSPASRHPELLGERTRVALETLGWLDQVGVVAIDADLSDTANSQRAYGLPPDSLANCVIVAGRREGIERFAACVILFTTRADINNLVKRRLDVRKASFLSMDRAVELTGMEYGGINPIGLPGTWPVLVDRRVVETDVILTGSGIRGSKLLFPGSLLGRLSSAEVIDDLGTPVRSS